MFIIPVHIAVLVVLMRLFAKEEADTDLPKCVIIFGVMIVGLNFAALSIGGWAVALYFAVPWVVLALLFYVPWGMAAAVSGCFTAYLFVFGLILSWASR